MQAVVNARKTCLSGKRKVISDDSLITTVEKLTRHLSSGAKNLIKLPQKTEDRWTTSFKSSEKVNYGV